MVNKVILQGRLTADPELRQSASGVSSVFFTVAWSEKYKEIEKKCFLPCKAWRATAEFICKFFKKGQELIVFGKLITEEWTDKDGVKRSSLVLDVEEAHFCGPKRDRDEAVPGVQDAQGAPAGSGVVAPQWETVSSDEGLPF